VSDLGKSLGPRDPAARRPALAAAALGLVLTIGISFAAYRIHEERQRNLAEITEVVSAQAQSYLAAWIEARLTLVEHLARHWPERYADHPDAFRNDARLLVERLEGVQAVNWVDPAGTIRLIVPHSGNEAALGERLAEHPEPDVQRTLARARRSGAATRTGTIELLQGGSGFATYWPVRTADGSPAGFVNGVFRIDDLIRISRVGRNLQESYRFRIDAPDTGLVWSSEPASRLPWPFSCAHSIDVVDRRWQLTVAPSARLVAGTQPKGWALALLTGCYLATGLLTWLVYTHLLRHEMIQRRERTLRALVDRLPHFISVKDAEGRFLVANHTLAAAYGCSPASLIGKRQHEFHPSVVELDFMTRCERTVLERDEPVRIDEEPFTDGTGQPHMLATVRVPFCDPRSRQPAVLSVGVDVSDRIRAEALHATFARAMDHAGEAIVVMDPQGRILFANLAFARLVGFSDREIRGLRIDAFASSDPEDQQRLAEIKATVREGRTWSGRYVITWTDGSRHARDATVSPLHTASGRDGGFIGVLRDTTRERQLEKDLRQAHKMEAIGRLAGGVAHDFNNLLMVILSCTETLQATLTAESPEQESAALIREAADRAAELTRQLLAFSRRQTLVQKVVDLGDVVRRVAPLIEQMGGPAYPIDLQLDRSAAPVEVDPGQIERALFNLCANARDAMPEGGTITISLLTTDAGDESIGVHPELRPGRYAVLTVADAGHGIDPALLERIFDPFFTTKEVGSGTGLGLSTVYGIAEQSGGAVQARSAPGDGTALSLWLPLHGVPVRAPADPAEPPAPGRRPDHGTILLAEDEPAIRKLVTRTLSKAGYRVLAAGDGQEALEQAASLETLSLLITDLAMPRLNGLELRDRLRARHPGLPVLFMSGFVEETAAGPAPEDPVLEKPFRSEDLLARVRDLLG